jgi:hypothetical protein
VDPERVAAAAGQGFCAHVTLAREPLFWTRVVAPEAMLPGALQERLHAAGLGVRYVASAERPSLEVAAAFDAPRSAVARPDRWPIRTHDASHAAPPMPTSPGTWFLRNGDGGIAADWARWGAGKGRRLAVIDDDALEADRLNLDAEVLIDLERAPRHGSHGALMVAWAASAKGFAGVAPRASARLYLIPKPGKSVVTLPLAIARAVFDGADVVLCATYVDGSNSPMLDDALEVAARLGRGGRGAAVVLPTGRETSSAAGSVHASFSLGLGEPSSDPRVFCVAPGAHGEGWFLWRDRRGRLRPFGNRGPAVRWLAPGDDLAYPFPAEGAPERLYHAESSGASAVAAGVLLLVMAANPTLRRGELAALVDGTLSPVASNVPDLLGGLADPADLLPAGCDPDGHDAKHGYGLLHARHACLAASDPVCGALLAIGEDTAAHAYADLRWTDRDLAAAYSVAVARWAVRALLDDREAALALRAIMRHLRLVAGDEARLWAHGPGAVVRALGLLVRRLLGSTLPAPRGVRAELCAVGFALARLTRDASSAMAAERRIASFLAPWFGGAASEAP